MIPLFRWSLEDRELLKGSPTLTAAQSLSMKLKAEFDTLEETVFSLDREHFPEDVFNMKSWEWAFAVLFLAVLCSQKKKLLRWYRMQIC